MMVGVTLSACSSNLRLSADVDYRSKTCSGLGREFGRYLDTEIRHIEKTGEPRYVVARRSGPPIIRDILDMADNPTPEDEFSLIFFAPAGHLLELGKVIRKLDLTCSAEQLAAASDGEVSEEVKATLLRDFRPPDDPQRPGTWEEWWQQRGSIAVSTPLPPPGTGGSAP